MPNPINTYKSFTGLDHLSSLDNDNKFSNYIGFGAGSKLKIDLTLPHDKYYSMLLAFMFIKKYIPAGTAYIKNGIVQSFQDGETDIREEVVKITNRCHPYLRGNTFGGPGSNWIMEYPDGTNLNHLGQPFPYSHAIAKMICHINDSYPFSIYCNSYQDFTSLSVGLPSYNNLWLYPVPSITPWLGSDDAAVFMLDCMVGSNSPVYSGVYIPAYIAMDFQSTINSMEWANLMRLVLHQKGLLLKGKSAFADPINQAPCKGPYNFGGTDNSGFEWKSQDRLEHPKSRYTSSPIGNYPGVDYMLLHNLYYEHLNQLDDKPSGSETAAYKNAYNFMDNEDNSIWPRKVFTGSTYKFIGVNLIDATHQTGNVKVFQNLKSTSHIYAMVSPSAPTNSIPSNVTYRAGREISLLPGFQVDSGSLFHGYIKRYVCGVDDYEGGMRVSNDTTHNFSNDYEGDDMNDSPIHYIEYPFSDSDMYPLLNENEELAPINKYFKNENELKMMPNPSTGIFNVIIKKQFNEEILNLKIYDMKGMLILNLDTINEVTNINLQNYSKGIYMVHINSSIGNTQVQKISLVD